MPFIAAPGVLKCEFLYHWSGGKPMANVLHLLRVSGSLAAWSVGELTSALADECFDGWKIGSFNIMTTRAGTVTLDKVVLTDLTTIAGIQAVSGRAAQVGGASGSALPSGTCALIKLSTATRSRHGRGRIYLPGLVTGDVDAFGAITSTTIGHIETGFQDFVTAIDIASVPMQVVVLNRAAGTALAMTTFACEGIARSQRRRELDH